MKLTGKAKIDFEMWYFNKFCNSGMEYHELLPHHMNDVFGWFYGLDGSFKWGVFVDFFDSARVHIDCLSPIIGFNDNIVEFRCTLNVNTKIHFTNHFKKRAESRKSAIEKANEIYNQRTDA